MGNENQQPLTFREIQAAFQYKLRATWELLVGNTRSRHFIGSTFSILFHLAVIGIYFGLAFLEQSEMLEIREITFVDETLEPQVEPQPTQEDPAGQPEKAAEVEQPTFFTRNSKTEKTPQKAISINERLDMPRRQAPINQSKNAPVVLAKSNSDILRVSPAHGTRTDNRVMNPSEAIKLEHRKNLQPTTFGSAQSLDLDKPGKPDITLAQKKMKSEAVASNRLSGAPKKPLPQTVSPSFVPKTTSTVITGQLAHREVVHKVVPNFPAWARKHGVGARVALSFAVMENGRVKENIIVVQTSGSSQWDDAVIEALKKWRFAPLNANGGRQDQTGVIVFQFVIE